MIELYQFWDSPCCMKVRMVLAEKGLDWELRPVTTYKFDHYQPAYQVLNPHSLVPTLVHDGRAIIQSSNIAEYLDDAFPDPPLKPADPGRRAEMREWMKEEEEFLFRLIVTLSFNTMMKMRAAAYGMDQLREWSLRHPYQARAQDYLERVSSPADAGAVAAADKNFAGTWSGWKPSSYTAAGPGYAVMGIPWPISALQESWTGWSISTGRNCSQGCRRSSTGLRRFAGGLPIKPLHPRSKTGCGAR